MGFESRRHTPASGDAILVRWHNVEIFTLPLADSIRYYVPIPSQLASYEGLRKFSVPSPSVFGNYKIHFLRALLLKWNIIWQIASSEYIISSVISFLATAQDELTPMGVRYGRVPKSVESGVLVPFLSQLVCAMETF